MPPDQRERLREVVATLAAIDRPSASDGERHAAEWIAGRLREHGWDARVEAERAHGTYWWPLGLLTGTAGIAALSGRRGLGFVTGVAAALGIADDVTGGPHVFRRLLPHRETFNVVAEAGDPSAAETIVFVSHHDAAHGGIIFGSGLIEAVADRFPNWYARQETSAQPMVLVTAGPLLAGLGALLGFDRLRKLGATIALGSAAAFLDIGSRHVVPGANDNLSAVAVICELGRRLREQPVEGVRVLLVSTGSEESFMEGMRGFMDRHAHELPVERTRVLGVESVGSPELILIEGEGMLAVRDYPSAFKDEVALAAQRAGVPLKRGLRLGLATDALIAFKRGYRAACLGSVTKYKFPANYHKQTDTAENVDTGTMEAALEVCDALVRQVAQLGR